ncbi:hypothetical protein BDV59DRAFT_200187 [Aspergillus ambiguus]|uniref:uncharacterized protein n=1 Tax=Aspergillus ambiguus TaxID=176160 RepID=UPI003CCE4DF0
MRSTLALAISLTAALASAHLDQRIPGYELALLGRDLGGNCTRSSTCDECFGDGNVVCDNAGCFNPHAAEQCCKNGNICVAKDNSCCDSLGGSGVTGTSGAVPTATATSTASLPESSAWTCKRFQSNEDCCQGGGPDMHWCSGDYPNTVCYNSTLQICCSQGTVCEGKGCCDLVGCVERICSDAVDLVGRTHLFRVLSNGDGDGFGDLNRGCEKGHGDPICQRARRDWSRRDWIGAVKRSVRVVPTGSKEGFASKRRHANVRIQC